MKKKKAKGTSKGTSKPRGFAAMSPERRKEVASKGGKAVQAKGTGHQWSRSEARNLASQGGKASKASGRGNRFDSVSGAKAARKRRKR